MNFIGIDPGQKGAIAMIAPTSVRLVSFDSEEYCRFFKEIAGDDNIVFVELVHAMPKQGVSSSFNFGSNFGFILGVISANFIKYNLVPPHKWKKELGCTSDKETSIALAKRLFPNVNLFRTARCKKEHDGFAEALLIAEYGRRFYAEKNTTNSR